MTTRLIVEAVTVRDKDEKPIEGLTARDFAVTEDGERQAISFVEFQRLDPVPETTAAARQFREPLAASPTADTSIRAPSPGEIGYRNRRLMVLCFDVSSMAMPDQLRAYDSALEYIETGMGAADLLALITLENGVVRVRRDFTGDRVALRATLEMLRYGDDTNGDGISHAAATPFGQDDAEFNIFNTDRQLSALQTAMSMLRPLPEQKAVVYFVSGLRLNGVDNQAQLRATTNAAIRANVAIYPIDARGLMAAPPLGDATKASPGGIAMFSGQLLTHGMSALQRSQDTLYALAKDTGGNALLDDNDLSRGILDAARAQSSYYLVGYYSTHTVNDGKYRRVRVALTRGMSADLSYRLGYFGDKEFAKFTAADKERQLEDALMLENPLTDLTIVMEVNYFQLNRAEYYVSVAVKIPGSEVALAGDRGSNRAVLDFIGEVKDDLGHTIQNLRDKVDITLTEKTASELRKRPIQYQTGFTVVPGKYEIKCLARNANTGRIGTYQTVFTIPNLVREDDRLPISSVVLGSQRVPLGEALYTVRRKLSVDAVNPLVWEGQQLMPSVTRVFSRSRPLHVFLQAYMRDLGTQQPLVAFVAFYQADVKAFETNPIIVTERVTKSIAVPLRLTVPLQQLPPGQYTCQVTVLDPTRQKAAFWQAPITVLR